MMEKVSMRARNEVIQRRRKDYMRAGKKEKGLIIKAVCETTGLSRDRVARLLRQAPRSKKEEKNTVKKRGRKPIFHERVVVELLEWLWTQMDYVCGKRLCPGLPGMVDALRRHGELDASEWAVERVLAMSPSTADRLLKKARKSMMLKGHSTTKPGSLLKKGIEIRQGTEWDENMPGYIEMDLVAHCGETTAGEYVNTLDMTDVYSGWTELVAVKNKARSNVFEGMKRVRERLPFTLLGLDSDNGGEFINHHMVAYCKTENLLFIRSRPYEKNDGCYVEQKNFSLVRRHIGYGRYEGQKSVDLMNQYYDLLRLYQNFFLPSMKLLEKTRDGSHVTKRYKPAKTPFQCLLDSPDVTEEQKTALRQQSQTLNPVALNRGMIALRAEIEAMALPYARPAKIPPKP